MTYKFKREPDSGLILVNIEVDEKFELKMIFDTGCSNTTIDSNALYLLGHDLKDSIGTVEIETANGIVETQVYELDSFSSLGMTKNNFQIQVYDFLAHGIFSDYNGLLGLDFLEGTKFCIDTLEDTLTINQYISCAIQFTLNSIPHHSNPNQPSSTLHPYLNRYCTSLDKFYIRSIFQTNGNGSSQPIDRVHR